MRSLAVTLVTAALAAGSAAAAVPPGGSVGPTTPSVAWEGQVYAAAVAGGSCPSGYSGTASWTAAGGGGGGGGGGATCSPDAIQISLQPLASVCIGVGL